MRHTYVVRLKDADLPTLIRAAQRDEPRAVDTLLGAIRPSLIRYFSQRLTPDLAEDLAQVALVRTVKALPRIEAERASAFIARIAQNLLRSAYKSRVRDARRYAGVSVDEIESASASDADVEQQDLIAAVRSASERALPRELRDIIFALLRGQSHAEIAAKQGISRVTVRTRLMRAREILRRELAHNAAPATMIRVDKSGWLPLPASSPSPNRSPHELAWVPNAHDSRRCMGELPDFVARAETSNEADRAFQSEGHQACTSMLTLEPAVKLVSS